MYSLEVPYYKLEDFFDEMLSTRQGEKYNFLRGRLIAIKNTLIEEERKYLITINEKKLHTLTENVSIEIPKNIILKDMLNLPNSINRDDLIELLIKNGLDAIFDNVLEMGLQDIITKINIMTLEEVLSHIDNQDTINYFSHIDSKAMKSAYEKYLVNQKDSTNIGRDVYEYIISNAKDALCPYCLHGKAMTVDHYLPKAYFIPYAITPINLLPCCSDCNKSKNDLRVLEESKMFINPYFDNINELKWLECHVKEEEWPITFIFNVKDDIENEVLKERLKMQFDRLKLGVLYASNAVRQFRGRVQSIVEEYESTNREAPIKFFISSKESIENYNLNSWEAKMYEGLLNSPWFLNDAIKELRNYYNIKVKT